MAQAQGPCRKSGESAEVDDSSSGNLGTLKRLGTPDLPSAYDPKCQHPIPAFPPGSHLDDFVHREQGSPRSGNTGNYAHLFGSAPRAPAGDLSGWGQPVRRPAECNGADVLDSALPDADRVYQR